MAAAPQQMCRTAVSSLSISFFNCGYHSVLKHSHSLYSEKKTTKVKTMDGVTTTHSGCVTPAATASGDESTDNGELGAEAPCEEMDATTNSTVATEDAVVGGPDADAATDKLATRYANLDSPADRYVCTPFSPLFAICVMTGQLAYCYSISHVFVSAYRAPPVIVNATSRASQSPFGWGCFNSLSHSFRPPSHTRAFAFFWGWLDPNIDWITLATQLSTSSARPTPPPTL